MSSLAQFWWVPYQAGLLALRWVAKNFSASRPRGEISRFGIPRAAGSHSWGPTAEAEVATGDTAPDAAAADSAIAALGYDVQ